ncbi:roadblock/LC7 domain-containing protein [Candidatus Thorarchaeota archaeon]|nr:MAG: roadblock/LC7 domain-containing protein [Candidatus Thorarchaeota archaeon]
MVDKTKIKDIVAETMSEYPDIEGIIVCDANGDVVFGHTIAGGVKHKEVAEHVVNISSDSSKLTNAIDKGGLKEVSISADDGFIIIFGDVKLILAAIAGEGAREQMGLIRIALKRALLSIID